MKYIKLFEQEYSMYDIITMTPGMAGKILVKECKKESPNMELIQNILEHSLVDINWETIGGWTALMSASWEGHIAIVRMLLERPEIDVNVQSEMGFTAFLSALRMGHTEIADLIKSHPNFNPDLNSGF